MPDERESSHGVMEGGGSYNRHARVPAGGGGLALPLLEQAAQNIALDAGDQPVVIADYGSSQGKNSLAPMRAAIRVVRTRVAPIDPSRSCMSIRQQTTSTHFSTCLTATLRVTRLMIQMYFPQRSEGRSIKCIA